MQFPLIDLFFRLKFPPTLFFFRKNRIWCRRKRNVYARKYVAEKERKKNFFYLFFEEKNQGTNIYFNYYTTPCWTHCIASNQTEEKKTIMP